jgi:hypothetical protein
VGGRQQERYGLWHNGLNVLASGHAMLLGVVGRGGQVPLPHQLFNKALDSAGTPFNGLELHPDFGVYRGTEEKELGIPKTTASTSICQRRTTAGGALDNRQLSLPGRPLSVTHSGLRRAF